MATETIYIDDSLIAAWKILYRHGDYSKIASTIDVPHQYIKNALELKQANENIFEAIKKFYLDRSEKMHEQREEAKKLNAALKMKVAS